MMSVEIYFMTFSLKRFNFFALALVKRFFYVPSFVIFI